MPSFGDFVVEPKQAVEHTMELPVTLNATPIQFSLLLAWTNYSTNIPIAGDLKSRDAHMKSRLWYSRYANLILI